MSATGRSKARTGGDNDDNPTPGWCVRRLLEAIPLPAGSWLEPCAGAGGVIAAVELWRPKQRYWTAIELQEKYKRDLIWSGPGSVVLCPQDFMTYDARDRFAVAITNPPYSLAEQFVVRMLELADWSAVLLRINWLASARELLRRRPPHFMAVIPNRPSFSVSVKCPKDKGGCGFARFYPPGTKLDMSCPDCGKRMHRTDTDASEYAWFVWSPMAVQSTQVIWLADTPSDERRAVVRELEP